MTGQEKALLRTIYFYKIAISMQCLETYAYEYTKKKLLKEVLDSIGSTYSISDEKNIIIETIENTDTYYFASIGKLENSKNTILTRFRTPTMEKRPYSLPGNSLLEMYTYFYLDYETGYMAVLDNNEAPKPPRYLQSLFSKELAGKFSGTVKVYPIRMKLSLIHI